MKNIFTKNLLRYSLCFLVTLAVYSSSNCQQSRTLKLQQLYDSLKLYQIDDPVTVLATAIFETGWLECRDCSMSMNNLFGFRLDSGYVQFSNYSSCIAYMKNWQKAFYLPWKEKHPDLSYYDFMVHVNYAQNMPEYLKNVKALEHWIIQNIEPQKTELINWQSLSTVMLSENFNF
jgi:hypothetical protein